MLKFKFIPVLLIIAFSAAVCCPWATLADDSLLDQAEALRNADPSQAKRILESIDIASLNSAQANRYEYLDIYLMAFSGDFKTMLKRYQALVPGIESDILRFKVYSGMMLSYQAASNWVDGLSLASIIIEEFERSDSKATLAPYLFALAGFYAAVDEHQLSNDYLDLALQYPQTDGFKCSASLQKAHNQLKTVAIEQLSKNDFERVIELCKSSKTALYVTLAEMTYAKYLLAISETNLALQILNENEAELMNTGYIQGKLSFLQIKGDIYETVGELSSLQKIVERILTFEGREQYRTALESAYRWQSQLAAERGDFQLAYEAFLNYEELRQEQLDTAVLKQKAVQQSRFESMEKQARIELLDKENQLLKTEAELSAERIENSILAFVLLSGLFTGLMIWSYRSRRLRKRFERLANIDGLTQIYNRTAFIERAQHLLEKSHKRFIPVVLIFFDLDKFKHINDSFGHQAGDWALKKAVNTVQTVLDDNVLFARMGGEEFALLKVGLTQQEGAMFAEKMRAALENLNTLESGHSFSLTASFGVSDTTLAGYKLDTLIASADLALYQAKKRGRNQVFQYNKGALN
ncbi:GGDEF domain-containing protein [Alteromonas sp. ASW11-36]|uniref:diguanylate cyclase n=1 Tax=Alteromonas arenosi TaxID=3055817 RepID=A0ABT7SWQ9_9ALTE|nr:GGDEF domain-containing protein [Alteromonas sp. ASW11-36]MDM7860623.1 GGDEF domain-containing protein [Alteromonas sp. ASW11-36]